MLKYGFNTPDLGKAPEYWKQNMDVKIQCACGSRYRFPVEPVNGQVPAALTCPNCGADWTAWVNEWIRSQTAEAGPPQPTTPSADAPAASPTPSVQIQQQLTTPAAPAAPMPAPETQAVRSTAATTHAGGPKTALPATGHALKPEKKARGWNEAKLSWGIGGAVGSALVAGIAWYLFIDFTTINFKAIALLVGFVIGVTCRMMSGGYSHTLGLVCAICAIFSIIGAQYFAGRTAFHREIEKEFETAYQERLAYAKKAVTLKTETEIRRFLAAEQSDDDDSVDPESISNEEIKAFQEELPALKKLTSGETSKEAYFKELRFVFNTGGFNLVILMVSLGLFGVVWLCIGTGLAYKLGTGEVQ